MATLRETQQAMDIEIVEELAHTNDPQSNGLSEQTVQSVKSKVLSNMVALEQKIGRKLPVIHPIVAWCVECTADCLNRYVLGADGRTVISRMRGRNPRRPVAYFGEYVMFKMLRHEREAWGPRSRPVENGQREFGSTGLGTQTNLLCGPQEA